MLFQLVAASGALALLTMLPGPDMAVVTRRTLVGGRKDATTASVGVVCGLLGWGTLAVLGLTALLAASPRTYLVVKLLGVAYLAFLGVRALRAHGEHEVHGPVGGGPFVTGLATNLLNPKIAVFYTALLPGLAPTALPGAWGLGTLVLIHAGLTLGWLSGYAYALTRARAWFDRPGVRRVLNRATGLVLVGFALRLATAQ